MRREWFVVVRNDDPSALSDAAWERKVLEVFVRMGIRPVWGIIPFACEEVHDPFCHACRALDENPAMVALIREAVQKGWIHPAMHGVTHRTNRLFPGLRCDDPDAAFRAAGSCGRGVSWRPRHPEVGFSEFNGLPEEYIIERLREGKLYLQSLLGVPLETFIFPWNALDRKALACVARAGFKHVLAGRRFFHWNRALEPIVYRDCEAVFRLDEILQHERRGLIQVVVHSATWNDDDLQRFEEMVGRCRDKGIDIHWLHAAALFEETRFRAVLLWGRLVERLVVALDRYWDTRWRLPVFYRVEVWREFPLALKMMGVWLLHKKAGYKNTAIALSLVAVLTAVLYPAWRPIVGAVTASALLMLVRHALKTRRQREIVWRSYRTAPTGIDDENEVGRRFQRLRSRPEDTANYHWLRRRFVRTEGLEQEKIELLLCGGYLNGDRPLETIRYFWEKYKRRGDAFLAYLCAGEWARRDPLNVPEEVLRMSCPPPPPAPLWKAAAEPGISVVLLAGRDTQEVSTALESLVAQTFKDFEVVLVDNTPSGLPDARLHPFAGRLRLKRVRTKTRLSPGAARNEGLRCITREWVTFLDDDDVYYPDHLERFWRLRHGQLFLYTGLVSYRGRLVGGIFKSDERLFVWNEPVDVRTISRKWRQGSMQVMVHRVLIQRHGLLRTGFCPAEDSEWFGRLYRDSRATFTGEVTCEYRLKEDNATLANRLFNHCLGKWVMLHCASFESDLPRITAHLVQGRDDGGLYESIRERLKRGHFIDIAGVADLILLAHAKDDAWMIQQVLNQFSADEVRAALKEAGRTRRGLRPLINKVSAALFPTRLTAMRIW